MRLPLKQGILSIIVCVLFFGISAGDSSISLAQGPASCSKILTDVQQHLSEGCKDLGKDEVCYGNRAIAVQFQDPNDQSLHFAQPGDITPLSQIKTIQASPLRPD